jgi:hypothetical protein
MAKTKTIKTILKMKNPYEPILEELSLSFLSIAGTKLDYHDKSLFNATLIMQEVLMSKMYDLQEEEQIPMQQRAEMATKCGEELRKLIKTYTGLDTYKLARL